jgi:cytochrome c
MQAIRTIAFVAGVAVFLSAVAAAEESKDLAVQARGILQHYCFECHGQTGSAEGGMDYVVDLAKLVERGKVVPGEPDASKVMQRLRSTTNRMPPDYAANKAPNSNEIQQIESWIKAGAHGVVSNGDDSAAPRTPVTTEQVIGLVHAHLQRLDPEDRPYQRYFTLAHLHNQSPKSVSAGQLRSVRAAVTKVLNSLSWRFEIVVPTPLDAEQTVLAFDLRDVDWDSNRNAGREDLWLQLVGTYPYGLTHEQYPDIAHSREMAKEIYGWTGVDIPWVRADWFVSMASQPPLYHTLLYDAVFPELEKRARTDVKLANGTTRSEPAMTAADLERWLRVDVAANIRRGRAARAGFANSGVSKQSRVVERHPALYGAYWKSYDFGSDNSTNNVQVHPLGPPEAFTDKRLRSFEFSHNGGEIIFNLPNGLQGYLLVNAKGERINVGPTNIVRDRQETIGIPDIVNGLSCMACHKNGMLRSFSDEVRRGSLGFPTLVRDRVRRLYLDPGDLKPLLDRDERRFVAAAELSVGPFLRDTIHDRRVDQEVAEPVGPVAKEFLNGTLSVDELAAELGLKNSADLTVAIAKNSDLQNAGLNGVLSGNRLKRDTWEAGGGRSLFQTAAWQLKLGTPAAVLAAHR